MERNTKLVLCHHLGKRDANSTDKFMHKLSIATSHKRYQLDESIPSNEQRHLSSPGSSSRSIFRPVRAYRPSCFLISSIAYAFS
jgi:hypothetical protein